MIATDPLDIADYSALGSTPCLIVEAGSFRRGAVPIQSVVIGIDPDGRLPTVDPGDFDLLLTDRCDPPAPWVGVISCAQSAWALMARIKATPQASTILCQTLRLVEQLPFDQGLLVESLAYSTLLGGGEFASWRAKPRPAATPASPSGDLVRVERAGDLLTLILDNPGGRNAMTAAMRDALYTALANAMADPSRPQVRLIGAGRCFSTGGDLTEFGTARDLATAHIVRSLHANARLCRDLGDRLEVVFHGAAIGSGLEVPAAAHCRSARPGTWFQLPELSMGLIPGAGGTVTLSDAIGRHRTAWMVLSGARVALDRALSWGLVQRVLPA